MLRVTGLVTGAADIRMSPLFRHIILFVMLTAGAVTAARAQFDAFYETWRWAHFTTATGLPSDVVEDVVETDDGMVWATTRKGLAWYDKFHWHSIVVDSANPTQRIRVIEKHSKNKLLIIVNGALFLGDVSGFHRVRLTDGVHKGRVTSVASIDSVSFLYVIENADTSAVLMYNNDRSLKVEAPPPGKLYKSKRTIWYSSSIDTGMYFFNGKQFIRTFAPVGNAIAIRKIAENVSGNGVFAMDAPKNKIGIWEFTDKKTIRLSESERNQPVRTLEILPSGDVLTVFESGQVHVRQSGVWTTMSPIPRQMVNTVSITSRENGDLWIGTESGLYLFNSGMKSKLSESNRFSDPSNIVFELFRSRDGDLWVGTFNGIEIHSATGSIKRIELINGTPLGLVTGINQDQKGDIWVCAGGGAKGLFRWDGVEWKEYFRNTISFHKIRSDKKGNLWFLGLGNSKSDPAGYVRRNETFYRLDSLYTLPSNRIYSFAEDSRGVIYLGTNSGLIRVNGRTPKIWGAKELGRNIKIYSLAMDQTDKLWFSTFSSHLGVLSGDDSIRWEWQKEEEYEYNEKIWDLVCDPQGILWAATTRGLFRFDSLSWTYFGNEKGEIIRELRVVLPLDSTIFLGGHGIGVREIDRKKCIIPIRTDIAPPIVDHNSVHLSWHPIASWGRISSDEIETRYQIDGQPWSAWTNHHSLVLDNFPSGTYFVKVQSKDFYGNVFDCENVESFDVEPPFYLRAGFYLPFGAAVLYGILASIQLYRNKKKYEQMMFDQRTRISNDLHDDVGSNLGSIALVSQRVTHFVTENEKALKDMKVISETALHTADDLRDIVWYINPRFDNLSGLETRFREIAARLTHNVQCSFEFRDEMQDDIAMVKVRRDMLLMYKEMLHNITRHSRATMVHVQFVRRVGEIELVVKDNGVGFDKGKDYYGSGIRSLFRRAQDTDAKITIESAAGLGTTITIVFGRKIL